MSSREKRVRDDYNDVDGDDGIFSFPVDTAEDAKVAAQTQKKIAKKAKSGGFQSLNLLPSV
jgi:hypothetical protein